MALQVTQDFLEYVQERQEEGEEGGGGGRRKRRNRSPPPPYTDEDTANDIPHLTTDDMVTSLAMYFCVTPYYIRVEPLNKG